MSYRIQIDDVVRDATDDEIEALNQRRATFEANEKARVDALAAKASATAKLKALGLTDDEIAALIP